jgi:hypothetical protein
MGTSRVAGHGERRSVKKKKSALGSLRHHLPNQIQYFVEIDDFAIVIWPLNPLKQTSIWSSTWFLGKSPNEMEVFLVGTSSIRAKSRCLWRR